MTTEMMWRVTDYCRVPSPAADKTPSECSAQETLVFPMWQALLAPFHHISQQLFPSKTHLCRQACPLLCFPMRNYHQKELCQRSTLQLLAMGCFPGYGKVCTIQVNKYMTCGQTLMTFQSSDWFVKVPYSRIWAHITWWNTNWIWCGEIFKGHWILKIRLGNG